MARTRRTIAGMRDVPDIGCPMGFVRCCSVAVSKEAGSCAVVEVCMFTTHDANDCHATRLYVPDLSGR